MAGLCPFSSLGAPEGKSVKSWSSTGHFEGGERGAWIGTISCGLGGRHNWGSLVYKAPGDGAPGLRSWRYHRPFTSSHRQPDRKAKKQSLSNKKSKDFTKQPPARRTRCLSAQPTGNRGINQERGRRAGGILWPPVPALRPIIQPVLVTVVFVLQILKVSETGLTFWGLKQCWLFLPPSKFSWLG